MDPFVNFEWGMEIVDAKILFLWIIIMDSIAHQDGYWTMGYHVTIGSQAALVECAGCIHWRGKTRGFPMVLRLGGSANFL